MPKKKVAVILAGAVARGAFEAGVLKVLAQQDFEITRLVAASAGALNAVLFASYLRSGAAAEGAQSLVDMWIRDAGPRTVFSFSPLGLWRRQGLFSARRVRRLLRSRLEATASPSAKHPVSLRIVVAPLRGISTAVLDARARREDHDGRPIPPARTTYEYLCDFTEEAFADEAGRARVIEAALASSAFPFVFTPIEIADEEYVVGPCIDGGAVNNAPIKWALGGAIGDALDAIIVVSPNPEIDQCPPDVRGFQLIGQTVTALINERLCRDLREAERVNEQLENLRQLEGAVLDRDQLRQVLGALGWSSARQVGIIPIRPKEELGGNLFSAFFRRKLRETYVAHGEDCARAALTDDRNRGFLFDEPPRAEPARAPAAPSAGLAPGPP